jgi:hypothetical protein
MNNLKKTSVLLSASILSLIISGCGYDNDGKNIVGAQKIVNVIPLFDIPADKLQPIVSQIDPTKAAFGVKGYKVIYNTKDEKGNDIKASGLVTVPVPTKAILKAVPNYSMSIVSDQHGTIFKDSEAPTNVAKSIKESGNDPLLLLDPKNWTLSPILASSVIGGFLTIQPDYIGFGESKDTPHPYLLEKSSASTVIDLIKSTIKFSNDNSLPINGQIYLTGYSEGGYVTLAASDEIEKNHPELHLNGVAPMSGPYDLNLTGMGVLSQPTIGRPDFIGGIVYSYAQTYDYNLNTILNEQYASKFETLYDKTKGPQEIIPELTTTTTDFFNPTYMRDFLTNPKNNLRVDFVENSVDDFKPTTPTRLLYCGGDKTIDPRITLSASKKMGVNSYDLNSSLDHIGCFKIAYPAAIEWFAQLRSPKKGDK